MTRNMKTENCKEKMTNPKPVLSEDDVAEWVAFGPKKLKSGKRKATPEEIAKLRETGSRRKAFCRRLAAASGGEWSSAQIEKELDRLAKEDQAKRARPDYLDAPSGTRDFYPEELTIRNWLFRQMREAALSYGFEEYDAPVLENVGLYECKAGEETDIVQQMYAFKDGDGKRVALRPEMTPSLARMVLNRTNLQTGEVAFEGGLPLKWFSINPCWRFETTQRGRKREFYQWNMDVVGVRSVNAEAEVLAASCDFFRKLGIGSDVVGIKVNSRAILEALLAKYGIGKGINNNDGEEDEDLFTKVCIVIDKLEKSGPDKVKNDLGELGVCADSARAILEALEARSVEELQQMLGETTSESPLAPAIEDVKRLFRLAEAYGFQDYLIFDASVVRGLAYYTGIVWEAFDRRGELRAIMGGGRYDRLLELYGGSKCNIPCVGFGFGDCVIMELLNDLKLVPSAQLKKGVDYVVLAFSDALYETAVQVSTKLRLLGYSVDLMPSPKKNPINGFAYANRTNARRIIYVAPSEVERGCVRIKDMTTRKVYNNGTSEEEEGVEIDCPLDALNTAEALIELAILNST